MDESDRLDDPDCDATLVGAVRRGDVLAFEALYRRHVPAVAMIARDQVRDPDGVTEAIQETFARALDSLPRLEDDDRFRPWLLAIARHTAVDARRGNVRLRPEPLDTVDDLAAPGPGPQELAELAELAGVVRGAVTGLSRRDAAAIALVAMGFGVADVAAALGIRHGAAKVVLHRARRRLKARVLMNVLAQRQGAPCSELAALRATDLLAIARHLDTCNTCTEVVQTVLV